MNWNPEVRRGGRAAPQERDGSGMRFAGERPPPGLVNVPLRPQRAVRCAYACADLTCECRAGPGPDGRRPDRDAAVVPQARAWGRTARQAQGQGTAPSLR